MPFDAVTLAHADVSCEVVPARGAIVTALRVRGKDVLYLDRATLDDATKNVRGGIPVLFPFAGRLPEENFRPSGTKLAAQPTKMKQHGFGRNKAWTVTERSPTHVRMSLAADADTRAQYPYDFLAEQTVALLPRGLAVELQVASTGPTTGDPLPVAPGWHPYFCCPAADKARVTGDVAGLTADKLGDDREFDFGLVAPRGGRTRFQVPGLGALLLSASPEMRHLQFWSQPGKPFICLEPFFGAPDIINTDRRGVVPAGEARTYWMKIELE